MALERTDSGTSHDSRPWPSVDVAPEPYRGPPRNIESIKDLKWEDHLQPKRYEISGPHPESKILFLDVNILDSSSREPFRGDVLIKVS